MKLYYFYTTDSDTLVLKDLFESKVPSDFDKHPQICENVTFCKKDCGGGYLGWINKYNTIMKGFEETAENEYFIFSDIDVVFYKSFLSDLDKILSNKEDILFQMETPSHDVNIGFMLIKNCDNSKQFWQKAYETIETLKYENNEGCMKIKHRRGDGSGQFVINDMLYSKKYNLSWSRLPPIFWSRSIGMDHLKDIYIHHANCTYSLSQKLNQIELIKNKLIPHLNDTTIDFNKLVFGHASISKEEFIIIENLIQKFNIQSVLEFGPGTSTAAFIKHDCAIVSIENNPKYIEENKQKYANYSKIEFVLNNQNQIEQLVSKLSGKTFDLCFIDGPRADTDQYKMFSRIDSYILASQHAKYIICHDSNRPKDRNSINLVFDPNIYNIEELSSNRGLTLIYKK